MLDRQGQKGLAYVLFMHGFLTDLDVIVSGGEQDMQGSCPFETKT
jgi:hypothetical protein